MPPRPEVTVVVPTRDRWDLLSTAALPSALGQQGVDVEVIVVDDGSRDGTTHRLTALEDARLRVIRHRRALGVARARNAGVHEARGEWIAFLDDDDLWSPHKLRMQVDAARAARAGFAYAGAAAVSEERSWLYSLAPVAAEDLTRLLLVRNVLWGGSSNVLARADVVRRAGGFDEKLFQLCDWDLWIRLALAETGAASDDVLVGCVVHPRSMLLVDERNVFEEFTYLRAKHHASAVEHSVQTDGRIFTRWVALGHRRAGRRLEAVRTYVRGALQYRDVASAIGAIRALVGPTPDAGRVRARRTLRARDGWSIVRGAEPDWLALYRDERALTIAQATSNASSPTES